jgi:hypothetical protein
MENNKQTTSEKFRVHIAAWKESGQSKMKFCKAHQINYSCFIYWSKKFPAAGEAGKPDSEGETFQQLNITGLNSGDSCLFTLIYPNNCELKIHRPVEAQFLNQLVALCR